MTIDVIKENLKRCVEGCAENWINIFLLVALHVPLIVLN